MVIGSRAQVGLGPLLKSDWVPATNAIGSWAQMWLGPRPRCKWFFDIFLIVFSCPYINFSLENTPFTFIPTFVLVIPTEFSQDLGEDCPSESRFLSWETFCWNLHLDILFLNWFHKEISQRQFSSILLLGISPLGWKLRPGMDLR